MTANSEPCQREGCGHLFLDHAPNWLVVPALNGCTECDCPEFVGADNARDRDCAVCGWPESEHPVAGAIERIHDFTPGSGRQEAPR